MRPRNLVLLLCLVMAFGGVGVSGAGEPAPDPDPNPNWFNDPVEGPSPNLDHVVGNEPDGECVDDQDNLGRVHVSLLPQEGAGLLASESYDPDAQGDWGETKGPGEGAFDIPSDLDPGTYPLAAACIDQQWDEQSPPGELVFFEYEDRSYTVVVEAAEPVEAEPTFTG